MFYKHQKEFQSQLTNNAAKFQEYNTSLLVLKDPTESRYVTLNTAKSPGSLLYSKPLRIIIILYEFEFASK